MQDQTRSPGGWRIGAALLAAACAVVVGASSVSCFSGAPFEVLVVVVFGAIGLAFFPTALMEGWGLAPGGAVAFACILGSLFLVVGFPLLASAPLTCLGAAAIFLVAMTLLLRALVADGAGDEVERSYRLRRRGRHAGIAFVALAACVVRFAMVMDPQTIANPRIRLVVPHPDLDRYLIVLAGLVVGLMLVAVLLISGLRLRETSLVARLLGISATWLGSLSLCGVVLDSGFGLLPPTSAGIEVATALTLLGLVSTQLANRARRRKRERNVGRELTGGVKVSLAEARRIFGVGDPARWTSREP